MTKKFPSVFQYCQNKRDFISSLIEVTGHFSVVDSGTVKVMFIIHC